MDLSSARIRRAPASTHVRAAAAMLAAAALCILPVHPASASWFRHDDDKVRLVLQITVDQLRPDLVLRVKDRWSKGGFRRLYGDGVVFDDARHAHANTETIVGHATLASGADPSVHGMIGNVWLNRASGDMQYNIEDSRYRMVGNDGKAQAAAGHAEAAKLRLARSPEAMLSSTIADSIAAAGGGDAKVYAVSLKDRGAVPMAGRAGKALWWSDATGEFVSSTFYFPGRRLPGWVREWNEEHGADHLDGSSWTLLLDPSKYLAASRDDEPWEAPPGGQTRVFPHRLDRRKLGDSYYVAVEASPFGDQLLLDFVRKLMREEELGDDEITDYLSVSFSANDYIGHRYGPDSLETEDEILRLDREIAVLLEAADKAAGSGHTLVVLSSDHGVGAPPEELLAEGKDAGHVLLSALLRSPQVRRLDAKIGGKVVRRIWPPYVYLDDEALRKHHIDPDDAAAVVAREIEQLPGVHAAYSRGEILAGDRSRRHGMATRAPSSRTKNEPSAGESTAKSTVEHATDGVDVFDAVRRSYYPERSGDIHVVPRPGWQISYEGDNTLKYATGHGTPWLYDSQVPLIFAGAGLRHREVERRVSTTDIAPTIAAFAGVEVPAGSTGRPLPEVER